jgi:hypothetical protein
MTEISAAAAAGQHRFALTTHVSGAATIQNDKNRNFMTHPITAEESNRLFHAMRIKHLQKHDHPQLQEDSSLDVMTSRSSESDSGTILTPPPPPFLRLAVCHPTIFIPPSAKSLVLLDNNNNATTTERIHDDNDNNMMLQRFLAFASYYRLLGFEHLFFWYERSVAKLPYFDQFAALPYVTLTEYREQRRSKIRTGGDDYHGQGTVADLCLQDERYARLYDWVLSVDADEYLWLAPLLTTTTTTAAALNTTSNTTKTVPTTTRNSRHRLTIHDFLEPYHAQNYNYISIGKFLYSTMHVDGAYENDNNNTRTSTSNDKKGNRRKKNNPFGLLQYPYTPGPYCYKSKRRWSGHPYCPNWMGRSKILVRPAYHSSVQVHGTSHGLFNNETGIHVHALEQAHLKEWIWIHEPPQPSIVHFDNASFHVTHNDQFQTYYVMESSRRDEQDRVEAFHDGAELREWFDFVSQQLSSTVSIKDSNNYEDYGDKNDIYYAMNIVHKPHNRGDDHHSIKKYNDTKRTSKNKDNIKKVLKRASRVNPPPPPAMSINIDNNDNNNELQHSASPIMKKHILRLNQQLQHGRSAHKLQKLQSILQPQEQ